MNATETARLARITGLPNLSQIVDPERLEQLAATAEGALAHTTLQAPLRYKVALSAYAAEATRRLENHEEL